MALRLDTYEMIAFFVGQDLNRLSKEKISVTEFNQIDDKIEKAFKKL